MADIKLFELGAENVRQLEGRAVALERQLQSKIENHLEEFLGILQ